MRIFGRINSEKRESRRRQQELWAFHYRNVSMLAEGREAEVARWEDGFRDLTGRQPLDEEERQAHRHQLAVNLADQAREAYGPDTKEALDSLVLVGYYYVRRELYDDAERAFTEALDVSSRVRDVRSSALPQVQNGLADVYIGMRQPARAAPQLVSAIAGYSRLVGPRTEDVAQLMKKLGVCRSVTGQHDEAIALLASALEIMEERLGSDHERSKEIGHLYAEAVLRSSTIVFPEDLSGHEQWRDFARRICRYLGDQWADRVFGRQPGVVIHGEKMTYFALPGADGSSVAVHELEGVVSDMGSFKVINTDAALQAPGRLIANVPGIRFPS